MLFTTRTLSVKVSGPTHLQESDARMLFTQLLSDALYSTSESAGVGCSLLNF
jgi:hypothetical protein